MVEILVDFCTKVLVGPTYLRTDVNYESKHPCATCVCCTCKLGQSILEIA